MHTTLCCDLAQRDNEFLSISWQLPPSHPQFPPSENGTGIQEECKLIKGQIFILVHSGRLSEDLKLSGDSHI
jgi:hypothetical protein